MQTESPARGPSSRAPWKSHIIQQLKQRDHSQKTRFKDLIHTYNKLLEKSGLLKQWTEKLQADPVGSPPTHFTRSALDPLRGSYRKISIWHQPTYPKKPLKKKKKKVFG
ncbi:protein Atg16l2-like [Spea bombifrons]|uniref:protein Atg16l2-like n=1 Tax=Spea bombifrons TaxID=233779 RepID=UPI00234B54C1|nr:protein Atg16l2-like [Spea bombifrons]